MKLNFFNKFLTALLLLNVFLLILKVIRNKPWDREYFSATVRAPEFKPINIYEIWFESNGNDIMIDGPSFYESKERVNNLHSSWTESDDYNYDESSVLPAFLKLSYYDYETGIIYKDKISLPKEKIKKIFKEAKRSQGLHENSFGFNSAGGLAFVVGIAGGGQVIIFLKGADNFVRELVRHPMKMSTDTALIQIFNNIIQSNPLPKEYDSLRKANQVIQVNYIDQPIVDTTR